MTSDSESFDFDFESLGTIIGGKPTANRKNPPVPVLRSVASKRRTYNGRVEWALSEDGSDIAVFRSIRYRNHTFKFFVSRRANGDQFASCMQCLDANRRRMDLQQPLLSQPTIQIVNQKWMEPPDLPSERHICVGNPDESKEPKGSAGTSRLKESRLGTASTTSTTTSRSSSKRTLPNYDRPHFLYTVSKIPCHYKLGFSVDAMQILRDSPGPEGRFIINEMRAANGDPNKIKNQVRLSLVRIMTEYLMMNCKLPGYPTTDERIIYTQMFLAQLPVTFDVFLFGRHKGFLEKRIRHVRRTLIARKRIDADVPMSALQALVAEEFSAMRKGMGLQPRLKRSSKSEEDEGYGDEDSMEGDEDEQAEERMDKDDGEEDMDGEDSDDNLLVNVFKHQRLIEQQQEKEESARIKQLKKEDDQNSSDDDIIVEYVKPSTSTNNAAKYSIKASEFLTRRSQLVLLKKFAPEQYPSRFMAIYPQIFETNETIHKEFSRICPQVKTDFVASWKPYWMHRIIRYVKTLDLEVVWDLAEDASDEAISRNAFDQLIFVFMQNRRVYFRDHLWKIVLKCSSLEDLNRLLYTPLKHPIIVELTRGPLSKYIIIVDKQIVPVDGQFTDALQLLMELYQIFGMEYPWEFIRWFQFFEYVYGISTDNWKLYDALLAIPVRT